MAFYGDFATSFSSSDGRSSHSFTATSSGGSFRDHDDTNLIWSRTSKQWVDMQIMGAPWPTPDTLCPRNLSDNGGCTGARVLTTRLSADGVEWGQDTGCLKCRDGPIPSSPNPASRCKCSEFNYTNIIRPDPAQDPPELQFYRMRPFYLGDSGRLAAHTLQYAASPAEMNAVPSYGYWGPYCANATTGGFDMCHKGHGYGKMHGPHIMEEWWVSSATQTGAEDLTSWQRPYKRFRAVPHDVWLMAQPVVFKDRHLWVSDTGVYTLPLYRLAGVYAPVNGEFSTSPFPFPAAGLWLNAAAKWQGNLVTGGCDEGCAAYIMVELQYASTGRAIPGFERNKCMMMDVDGLQLPLNWAGSADLPAPGTMVRLRFSFRDATIYAAGAF